MAIRKTNMNLNSTVGRLPHTAMLIFLTTGLCGADEPTVRATLQPASQRQPAPGFVLKDNTGKTLDLKQYRGNVVLLDFWATWCHGCKQELPWFSDFQRRYREKGLRVIGASTDDEGWKVVQPFLAKANVPYPIVVSDEAMRQNYHIENMPDAFLIDRLGRIAAVYVGLVDKENIKTNILKMLEQR
jgi:cytochrome c biogenesis protein CcmG/thiol:disulfide interchange protein DsbE